MYALSSALVLRTSSVAADLTGGAYVNAEADGDEEAALVLRTSSVAADLTGGAYVNAEADGDEEEEDEDEEDDDCVECPAKSFLRLFVFVFLFGR